MDVLTTIHRRAVDAGAYQRLNHRSLMRRALLAFAVLVLYVLHQDVWFWRQARPLVFGFMPIGLFYHACYAVAAALLMWLLVQYAWPGHLEDEAASNSSIDKE